MTGLIEWMSRFSIKVTVQVKNQSKQTWLFFFRNHEILIKDILNIVMTHRVAVLDKDLCQPKNVDWSV